MILDKASYIERVLDILSDTSKFQKLDIKEGKDYNFIINQEKCICKTLFDLSKKGVLSEDDYARLSPCGSKPSVLYGLSKVHKTVIDNKPKQRPILSAINTPTYKLSKFLVKILEPHTKNKLTAKDSFSFANEVRTQSTNSIMASLDVEALFTNIPLEEAIDICVELAFKEKKESRRTQQGTVSSVRYCHLRPRSLYTRLYSSMDVTTYEEQWLASCPPDIKPAFYRCYVDAIFLLF